MKALIPAAGLGSQFFPTTKSVPKEMLPLLDKPALQYTIEEGVQAGIQNFVVISNITKTSIAKHLEPILHMDQHFTPDHEKASLVNLNKVISNTSFTHVYQHSPLGLGHAIWLARHAVGKEPMAIMLPDDIFTGDTPGIMQLIKVAHHEKCNVIAVKEITNEEVSRYGVISIKKQFSPNLFQVRELIEKPSIENAPSNLGIVGRYVLSSTIFDILSETQGGATSEINLTDAIQQLIFSGEKVFAYKIQGTHYDLGTPLTWLQSNLSLALKHPAYATKMMRFLSELDKEILLMQGKAEALTQRG